MGFEITIDNVLLIGYTIEENIMLWQIINYRTADNREPIVEWLNSFRDKITALRIEKRILKLRNCNLGDHKRFSGIIELRLHFGKGYRIYCGQDGHSLIILLAGGDKSTQSKDIKLALKYWEDYHGQKKV